MHEMCCCFCFRYAFFLSLLWVGKLWINMHLYLLSYAKLSTKPVNSASTCVQNSNGSFCLFINHDIFSNIAFLGLFLDSSYRQCWSRKIKACAQSALIKAWDLCSDSICVKQFTQIIKIHLNNNKTFVTGILQQTGWLLRITTPHCKCFRAVCQCHSSSTHREKDAEDGLKGGKEMAFTWLVIIIHSVTASKIGLQKRQTMATIIKNIKKRQIRGHTDEATKYIHVKAVVFFLLLPFNIYMHITYS